LSTIREVARLAGVAPITVSRVLNNAGPVNVETRARVEAAIAELHYVPNVLARSLRFKRTQTLALVLTDITNPFWTRVARGVEDTARRSGYSVILCNTDESESIQLETINLLLQKQTDGILLVPRRNGAALVERIRRQQVPVVVLDRRIPGLPVDIVRGDSEGGAYALTRLLLEQGHRRITLLSGPADVPTAADRAAGFRRALTEAGISLRPEDAPSLSQAGSGEGQVLFGEYSYASGKTLAAQALAAQPAPSALFAGNNLIATGALHAIMASGRQVPRDLSLVCFDDFPPELLVEPFFTTAAQPAYELGCQATRLLLERLSGESSGAPREIVLPVEIIARRSSRPYVNTRSAGGTGG
jgi:LacI family transcriptional regulator